MVGIFRVAVALSALLTTSSFAGPTGHSPDRTQGNKPTHGLIDDGFYSNAEGSPVIALMNAARQTLDVEIYTMQDLSVHQAVRDALHRGVKVRIIHEGTAVSGCQVFGTGGNAACADEQQLVKEVRAVGGTYAPFNAAVLCPAGKSCLEHGKMVIADGTTALISTGNFDSTNLCDAAESPTRCNRDYSMVTSDPSVLGALKTIYENDVASKTTDLGAVLTSSIAEKLTVSPESLPPLIAFVNSARESIEVQNQYLKEPNFNNALMAAARRGVKVTVMVASACAFGTPKTSDANKWTQTYSAFDAAGVKSKAFSSNISINGVAGYLHAKTIVVDGKKAWVGSVNGSTQAFTANREYGLFFSEAAWVKHLSAIMQGDWNSAGAETWQQSLACARDR